MNMSIMIPKIVLTGLAAAALLSSLIALYCMCTKAKAEELQYIFSTLGVNSDRNIRNVSSSFTLVNELTDSEIEVINS